MTLLVSLWANRSVRVAAVVLAVVAVLVVLGGALAPYDPLRQDIDAALQAPSAAHWLGTDYVGRDVLSRLMAGTRWSVVGALEAVLVAVLIGVPAALASVWMGPRLEWLTQRIFDTLVILPFAVFAIAVAGTLGNGLQQAMLAVGVLLSPTFFRITRSVALGLRRSQYVEAAELMGAPRWWILRHHIWSKVMPQVAVTAAQYTGYALLVVASLSFLGIGIQPPAPTWGGMLASDLGYLAQQAWAPLFPAALMMATVASLSVIADAVRDATGLQRSTRGRTTSVTAPAEPAVPSTRRPDPLTKDTSDA